MGEKVENATHRNVSRHCSLSNSQPVVTGCRARGKRGGVWSGVAGSQDSVAENRSRTPEARSPCTALGTELLHCLSLQATSLKPSKKRRREACGFPITVATRSPRSPSQFFSEVRRIMREMLIDACRLRDIGMAEQQRNRQ